MNDNSIPDLSTDKIAAARDRIIIAVDVPTADDALHLVHQLRERVGAFKIGLELFNAAGPGIFATLQAAGAERIFYDAKFHDIPNTVAGALRVVTRYGLWMVNLHASGGLEMMRAAREAVDTGAAAYGIVPPLLIAVTVLTSLSDADLHEIGVQRRAEEFTESLTDRTSDARLDGIVTSMQAIPFVRARFGDHFVTVVPGVRPAGAETQDQARVTTPTDAIRVGAHYLVIGRPITRATDPAQAADAIALEIAAAL